MTTASRTLVYRLQADSRQLKTEMAAASTSVRNAGTEMEGATKKGQGLSKGLDVLGISATTVAAGGIAAIVTKAADFDQAMANVQASTRETSANMEALREAAMRAGADTAFSATEAAAGIENLSKAGVSTADILNGGLTGALDLAAAGQLDVGQAAEIAATALTQFKLSGEDVPHVADLLAAGAGNAQGEVSDLSQALNQSGLVAGQMGLSIEETTGTLSAFASAGLLGSDAGTSLKTMLLRLANPSKEAAKQMAALGISAYDANGNLVPMSDLAGQLQTAFKGQSQATRDAALATIFGSDAIRAANVLYSEGATGIEDWTTKVDDAGYAAQMAGDRMDSLRGDVELLMGSIETGLIGAGEDSQGTLRTTVQSLTDLVDAMNEVQGGGSAFSEGFREATGELSILNSDLLQGGIAANKWTLAQLGLRDATKESSDATDTNTAATEAAAAANEAAAAAAEQYERQSQQTAAEIEAQAKALEEARKAASGVAGSFVTLGDSLNDAEKSLGDWITEMSNQADALNNFTRNAETAADRGLRKGLIAALKEAGPEGALRMKQLANATQDEIGRANASWDKGQKAINRYVDATVKVPKALATDLKLNDADAARRLAIFKNSLESLQDRNLTITTVYRRVNSVTDALPARAEGGVIYGPGSATSDSIPAMLSNGEYVIKAAAVDHYGLDTFDRLNAMHFAEGGSADKKKPKKRNLQSLDESSVNLTGFLKAQQAQATANMDAAVAQLNAAQIMSRASEVAALAAKDQDDAADKALEAAQAQYDSMKSQTAGLFNIDPLARPDSAWAANADPFSSLADIIKRTSDYSAGASWLAGRGLDGAALTYGLGSEDRMAQLGAMSDADLQRFEDMFNAANEGVLQASTTAADLAYGAQVAQATAAAVASQATLDASLAQQVATANAVQTIQGQLGQFVGQLDAITQQIGESAANGVVNGGNKLARRGVGHD